MLLKILLVYLLIFHGIAFMKNAYLLLTQHYPMCVPEHQISEGFVIWSTIELGAIVVVSIILLCG